MKESRPMAAKSHQKTFPALMGAGLGQRQDFGPLPTLAFPIAGFRFHDGAEALPELGVGTPLTLRAEPANPHDAAAVAILHGAAKLGYVPRFCNQPVSRLLREGVALACEISRIDLNAPPWEAIAVRIYPAEAASSAAPEFGTGSVPPPGHTAFSE